MLRKTLKRLVGEFSVLGETWLRKSLEKRRTALGLKMVGMGGVKLAGLAYTLLHDLFVGTSRCCQCVLGKFLIISPTGEGFPSVVEKQRLR